MVLNKRIIQEEVEATLKSGKYTEGLGRVILLFADVSVHKRGLNYRHNEFEVEFIIKPKIVDMLLLKVFKYNKEFASAYTFFSLITSTAIIDAISDIRRDRKGDSYGVFYIEDVKYEIDNLPCDIGNFIPNEVFIQDGVIKLN